jgi:RNA polymerase sigma-70 factor (ECF subfamily)
MRMALHAAVAALDDRDRELVALRYGADLSARQIAELLDLKTNAVEVALHRALRRLRDSMSPALARRAAPAPRVELRRAG